MKRMYIMLDDEPLDRRSIVLVETKSQAKSLVENKIFYSYSEVKVWEDDDIFESICDEILYRSKVPYEKYCEDCLLTYLTVEDCPIKKEMENKE